MHKDRAIKSEILDYDKPGVDGDHARISNPRLLAAAHRVPRRLYREPTTPGYFNTRVSAIIPG